MSTFSVADIPDMTGKTVIVTGASSGIGARLAEEMDRDGHRLFVCARRLDRLDQRALYAAPRCVQGPLE